MLFLLSIVNVDSNSWGTPCTRSIAANIISVSSHPRITIASRFAVIIHVPYGRPAYGPETPSFRVSTREKKGGKRKKKKKIAPKIERSRNKLNFAFGRSWNRVFVTYRCAFHFISLSLIRNFRRKCNIPLRDAISKVHAKKYFRAYGKPVTERHPWNSMPKLEFSKKTSFPRNHLY